jgi:hypothetical protein
MTVAKKQLRSTHGFESPYFVVDVDGNLISQTITVTGSRLELTQGSYLSYAGQSLLSQTTLGSTVTNIAGTLTGLKVNGPTILTGNLSVTGTGTIVNIAPSTTGTLDNVSIGSVTPAAGRFSSLSVTGPTTITPSGTLTLSPVGTLTLGTATQTTNFLGHITVLGNQSVTITPTDGAQLTINPTRLGGIDNVTIGQNVPASGKFLTVTLTNSDEKWNTSRTQVATKRYMETTGWMQAFFAMGQ